MKHFLCIIFEKKTKKELASYEIEAIDIYSARQEAISKFMRDPEKSKHSPDGTWSIDICEV